MKHKYSVLVGFVLSVTSLACSLSGAEVSETFDGNIFIPPGWTNDDPEEVNIDALPTVAQNGISESAGFTAWDDEAPSGERSTLNAMILVYEDRETAALAYEALDRHNLAPGAQAASQEADDFVERITTALVANSADDDQPAHEIYHLTILSCRTVIRYDIIRYETSSVVYMDMQGVAVRTAEKLFEATCTDNFSTEQN
jgi:hypothetical protein